MVVSERGMPYPSDVALPIGTLHKPDAHVTVVPFGEAVLEADWPAELAGRHLRGAVCAALGDAHVDFHQHAEGEERRNAAPPVLYRTDSRGTAVWAWGPRASANLAAVASLPWLETPNGTRIPVRGARVTTSSESVRVLRRGAPRYLRYELVTPMCPPWVAVARLDKTGENHAQGTWCADILSGCITAWLRNELGLQADPAPVVHLEDWRMERVTWKRAERGKRITWPGFRAIFWSNAVLPDGVGIGKHRSEGFGEVRRK